MQYLFIWKTNHLNNDIIGTSGRTEILDERILKDGIQQSSKNYERKKLDILIIFFSMFLFISSFLLPPFFFRISYLNAFNYISHNVEGKWIGIFVFKRTQGSYIRSLLYIIVIKNYIGWFKIVFTNFKWVSARQNRHILS